jgi:hypothetical protein
MTLHWLHPETRAREHAVLACRRLKGSHTFDVLAEAITDVHCKFGIQEKVTRTTTDNGSNFVKCFVQFASQTEALPALNSPDTVPEDPENELLAEPDLEQFVEEPEEEQYITVENVLEHAVDAAVLPVHMRCAAHTLNLVATADAEKALLDDTFQAASTTAMRKARQLWNAQSRSIVQADIIHEELKKRLVVPNATRWNSIYDAVVALNVILGDEKIGWSYSHT